VKLNHSSSFSDEVRNAWSRTSTSPVHLKVDFVAGGEHEKVGEQNAEKNIWT